MRATYAIRFYCRESKTNKQGFAPIELSIIINQQRVIINLPRKEKPVVFSNLTAQRKDNELKQYLDTVRAKLYEIQTDMLQNNIPLTVHTLRDYWKTGGVKTYTFQTLFTDFVAHLRTTNVAPCTVRKYQIVMDLWGEKYGYTKELNWATNTICREFYTHLQSKYEQSTVSGMATKIKAIFQYAINSGKLKVNPFNGIKIDKGEKDVEFLTESEIQKIITTPMPTPCLERVKDLFLWQTGTGQAYVDMANLTREDVQYTEDNTPYIAKKRTKTGQEYTTIVLPFAHDIWLKYGGNLPVISNQRYNIYLKAVQSICSISKSLHSHLARHSFACYALNKGIRLEVVAKALGHSASNLRQTCHYSKLIKKTVIDEMKIALE